MDACYPLPEGTVKVTTHSKSMSRLARATIPTIGNGILPSGQVPVSPLPSVSHVAALMRFMGSRLETAEVVIR